MLQQFSLDYWRDQNGHSLDVGAEVMVLVVILCISGVWWMLWEMAEQQRKSSNDAEAVAGRDQRKIQAAAKKAS